MLPNTNPLRAEHLGTVDDFEDVNASPLDLAHPYNNSSHAELKRGHSWGVFTSMLRHPNVGGIVSLPHDIAALCTKHCLRWPTEGLRDSARRGFRDFLQRIGSAESDAPIVAAIRPRLHNTEQSPRGEHTVAFAEIDAHSDVSSGDATPRDVVGSQSRSPEEVVVSFRHLRFHLTSILGDATDDDYSRSSRQNIDILESNFAAYSSTRTEYLQSLLHEDATTQAVYLASEYNSITDFLLPAVAPWNVTRKRVRRWVRSCAGSALRRLENGHFITGIFTPEMQANILYAIREHENCRTDESLALLRAQLPQQLLERPHRQKRKKNTPANNEAKKIRKRISEKIQSARQMVRWSNVRDEWETVFVAALELKEELGGPESVKMWDDWCFDLAVKATSDFPTPITKAEAFVAWFNSGYTWTSCRTYWDQLPHSEIEPRNIDDTSRERLKARLQQLVG